MSIVAVAAAAAVAIGAALASLAAAVSFRLGMLIPREVPRARVTLILAATGRLPDIEALFACLLTQTLRPTRLLVAVESPEDPACGRIAALSGRYPALAIELVVAGLSDGRAQKLTNLLAAFSRLGDADEFVVSLDADIRPQKWWLAALVAPLAGGRADIVSGYRWPIASALTPANVIVTWVDRAVAVLPRFASAGALWGGSLALTRQAIERIDMPATLSHALTEDLVIGDRAIAIGLRIVIRRGVRVPTPLRATTAELWRFARRQLQGVQVYRRRLWFVTLASHTGDLLARLALIAAAIGAGGAVRLGAGACLLALALLGSAATQIRVSVGRKLEVPDRPALVVAQHLLVWTIVPALLFYVSALWASVIYSPVGWAHVRYTVDWRGRVVAARRRPHR
jgi:hypothetical protein